MPTVPTYGGPRATLQPVRTTQERGGFAADELGDGVNRAVRQGIGLTAEAVAAERKKADDARLLSLRNDYERRLTDRMAEWNQRGGLDAQKSIDEFGTFHSEVEGELLGNVDPATADRFRQWAAGRATEVDRSLSFKAAAEFQKYDAEQFAASGELYRKRIADSYLDPQTVRSAIVEQMAEIEAFAERRGLPSDTVQMMKEKAQSDAEATIIRQHIADGNDLLARQHFEEFKDSLLPDERMKAQAMVEASSTQGEAFRIGDEIYQQIKAGALSKSDIMAKVKELAGDNTKVRAMAESRALHLVGLRDRAQAEEVSSLVTASYSQLIENGGDLEALDPEALAVIQAEAPEKLEFLENVALRRSSGERPTTDRAMWADFIGLVTDKPNDIALMTEGDLLARYSEHLSDSDFKQALNIWSGLRKGANNAEARAQAQSIATGIRTENQMMNASLRRLGIDPNDPGEYGEQIMRAYDLSVSSTKRTVGRDILEPQEITESLDRVTALIVDPMFRSPRLGPVGAAMVSRSDQIPEKARNLIVSAYKVKLGTEPSEATMVQKYNDALLRGIIDKDGNPIKNAAQVDQGTRRGRQENRTFIPLR